MLPVYEEFRITILLILIYKFAVLLENWLPQDVTTAYMAIHTTGLVLSGVLKVAKEKEVISEELAEKCQEMIDKLRRLADAGILALTAVVQFPKTFHAAYIFLGVAVIAVPFYKILNYFEPKKDNPNKLTSNQKDENHKDNPNKLT